MSKMGMIMMLANRNRSNRGGDQNGQMNNETRNNYDVDSRFRDRQGREHYDNGRFAPMRNEMQSNRWMPPYYDVDITRYEYEMDPPENRRGSMAMSSYPNAEMPHRPRMEGRENQMRMIGFNRTENNEMQMGGSDASIPHYREMERIGGNHAQSGGAKFQRQPRFDEQMAMEWVQQMQNADGTTGPHWSMEQLESIMKNKKIDLDPVEFFAAVNMIYSDYGEIIKKRNLGMDFYVDMAKAFLNDKDAGAKDKLAAYYEYVVKG